MPTSHPDRPVNAVDGVTERAPGPVSPAGRAARVEPVDGVTAVPADGGETEPALADAVRDADRPTGWRQVVARLARDRWAVAGAVIVVLTTVVSVLSTTITRLVGVDPYSYHLDLLDPSGLPVGALGGASLTHPFGLEPQTGRDLFAIVVEGTRTSFSIGTGATLLSMVIAIGLGLSAGYFGGWWDALVSRLTDVTLGFPHLVFMIAISAVVPSTAPRVAVMILIIGILGWPSTARVLRSRTLALRSRTFVGASRAMGAGELHVLTTQVLPNLVATIIVFTTISIPGKIGAEAALSFLGVGVTPPTPSWGRAIGSAVTWVSTDPWYLVFPGAALFLVTLAFNLFGDGLRDALDPRTGENR